MQNLKEKFHNPDHSKEGSLQSCIRTNDLELVGDGSHLTYFEMLGNFSFGNDDYEISVEMWDHILKDLQIHVDTVHVHPDRDDHVVMWEKRGYDIIIDSECVWSDGNIGGYCCEVYSGSLEIGNLVNSNKTSTDVGFGFERIVQLYEGKDSVQHTSLFRQDIHPIVSDHLRTIAILYKNDIIPGNKGRNYVCRRLIRRLLRYSKDSKFYVSFRDWLENEKKMQINNLKKAAKHWKRHSDKPNSWWWETFGILPEEMHLLNNSSPL